MVLPGRQRGFTLIDLLVTVTIIAVLAGLLIPTVYLVREKANRAICASNQRQCGAALLAYAADSEEWFPRGRTAGVVDPDTYHETTSGQPSLSVVLKGYLDLKAWKCPSTKAAPIDDPRNTAVAFRRSSLVYWPYLSYGTAPNLFKSSGFAPEHTSLTALLQDECYQYTGRWRSNHGRGGHLLTPFADNPSLAMTFDGAPRGLNILYGDGHAAWSDFGSDIVIVFKPGPSSVYSHKQLLH